ncbi:CG34169 [Drosophila busckii]|uniref:CG34169 n=1 Tax=Drosophila busckii TaxID=30019 RepID=A0A0M4EBQ5_DROBS|nr:uncharacterized protein LOC108604620 [Drosophila busckii]ALC40064.1 CG34169 [Drosophila busckii]
MRVEEVITLEQLQHHRYIASQINNTRDRWNDLCSWYPLAQAQQYQQFGRIYAESLNKFGAEQFKQYAERRRLRSCYTAPIYKQQLEAFRAHGNYPMNYLDNLKYSITTNGEYGLITPAAHHSC